MIFLKLFSCPNQINNLRNGKNENGDKNENIKTLRLSYNMKPFQGPWTPQGIFQTIFSVILDKTKH